MYTPLSANPYYDDYDPSKPYYKILFKPEIAVQAREMTQLQTQIQEQIKRFGDNVFVDGTSIQGGEFTVEKELLSIKLDSSYLGSGVSPSTFVKNTNIVGVTSESIGVIREVIAATTDDPLTIIIKLISGDEFLASEVINFSADGNDFSATIQTVSPFSSCILFNINKGIFYVNDYFINVEPESIVVDKYDNTAEYKIGFVVNETIITSDTDQSLLDNAQSAPNFAAPGADRYQIEVSLASFPLADTPESFVELARLEDGNIILRPNKTLYNIVGDELAKRTYDESGNYTVNAFPITLEDHQSDADLLNVVLDKGSAYVNGYQFETDDQRLIPIDRARTTIQANNLDSNISYGNFVYVKDMLGEFITSISTTDAYSLVELHNVDRATVADGTTQIGTANVRFIKYLSGTVGTSAAIYKMYLFNITTTDSFKTVESIVLRTGAVVDSGVDIDLLSKAGGLIGGDVSLSGTDARSLVFPLNHEFVADVRDDLDVSQTDFTFQRTFTNVNFTGATGVATISTDTGFEVFQGGAGAYSGVAKNDYYHVVVTALTSGAGVAVGEVIDMAAASKTITGGTVVLASPHSITLDADVSGTNFVGTVIATINANGQQGKTKTLSPYKIKIIATPNETVGLKDSFEEADIYDVTAVYNTSTTNPTTATIDGLTGIVTWTGVATQIDVTDRYELDNGQRDDFYDWGAIELTGTPPAGTDYLLIVYRNFSHSSSTGKGYFSVNSYDASGVAYDDIPEFVSPTTGKVLKLRDSVDFRPRRSDSGTAYELGQVPDPDFTFNADYSFYIGRNDILSVTRASDFSYKQGTPSQEPITPQPESSSMVIYTLEIPPYTNNLGDIKITYIDNKRYTMRDIGRLERRIQNVEYYTQLNFLEQQAKTQSVPDSNNSEKFKNGIFVDSFVNTATQAVTNADSFCYTDIIRKEVRAFGEIYNADITYMGGTNVRRTGDLITLDYTTENFVEQPFATETSNVNPFNVVSFIGNLNLEPSQDMWVETTRLPASVVTTTNTPAVPRWNWGFNWGWGAGWGWGGFGGMGWGGWGGWGGGWGWNWGWNGWWGGWRNQVVQTSQSLGDNTTDISFLPFIRARLITVIASGLKPNTTHYGFFDTTAVSAQSRIATRVVISTITGTVFDDSLGVYEPITFSSGATARVSLTSPARTDGTRTIYLTNVTGTISPADTITGAINGGTAIVDSITSDSYGDQMVTDEFGMVAVEFNMPGGTFRNGDRRYTLLSNASNNRETASSIGDGSYNAQGQQRTVQETILVTRSVIARPFWSDPIAESFLVAENIYPNGLMVTSLELFFATKAASIPVFVQIREMVNGFPKNTSTIPFADIELFPEDVNTSIDGSVGTTFTFPSPINLEAGEYCFVVLSNSNEYEVFVSVMGDNLIDNPSVRVTDQPYAGSMFSSQNGSTWTPNQEKDIKFNLNKAVFDTSGTADFGYPSEEFGYELVADTTSASADLTNVPDEAYTNIGLGMFVEGSGIPADTYITAADRDLATITLSNNASATAAGVTINMTGIPEFGTLSMNNSTIINNTTDISYKAKAMSKASSLMDVNYTAIENSEDYNFPEIKKLVPSALNGGNTSLEIQSTLTTGDTNTSPIIDVGRFTVVLAKNVINDSIVGEDSNRGGETLSRYITVPVSLADGFDASNLVVTFDLNKPAGTNAVVFMRTLPSEATTPMQDENWIQMDQYLPVPSSVDVDDYREHKFYPPSAFDALNVPIDNPIGERFNSFQIKVVFTSSNEAYTPKLKNFRLIALDT